MTTINEEVLKKITGEVGEEVPEAGYRLAAAKLSRSVLRKTIEHAARQKDGEKLVAFLGTETGEAVFGFALASALELAPTEAWQAERKRLAYNLRVQAYQSVGETLLRFAGFLNGEVGQALQHTLGASAPKPAGSDGSTSGGGPTP